MKNIVVLLLLCLISCNKSPNPQSLNADIIEIKEEPASFDKSLSGPEISSATGGQEQQKKRDTISRKIIKNGDMNIQVGDIKKAHSQANDILKKNNAYIQKEEFRNTDTDENLALTIRVPNKNFDALINSFSNGMGAVLSKNITANDVTEEYTDIAIRLANKRIYLEKYRNMLKKASTTKDILEIQEKIRELEDEIDTAEGKLRFIDDRVNYSTLNLNLYKEKVRSSATSKIGFGNRFADSLTEGWNSFVSFLLGLISLWPFFLIIPLIVFSWRKWKNRKKSK